MTENSFYLQSQFVKVPDAEQIVPSKLICINSQANWFQPTKSEIN